jgi:ribosomal protein S18 acetylase RimI-like enzyme
VKIRPALAEEAAAIGALVQAAYGHYVERIGMRPAPMDDDYEARVRRGEAWVAVDGADLLGAIVLVRHSDHLSIDNVAVDPGRQGEGIGRALLDFAEAAAREAGTSTVRLFTHAKMTENRAIYARLGYREIDRRDEAGFDRVFLVKELGGGLRDRSGGGPGAG